MLRLALNRIMYGPTLSVASALVIWVTTVPDFYSFVQNELSLINTFYKQPRHRLITWTSPDGKTQSQLDFLITPDNQKCLVKKCRVFNSFNIDSDHSLLLFEYKLFRKKPKQFAKAPKRFAVDRFKDNNIRQRRTKCKLV